MLRLNLSRDPKWIDLGYGVRVLTLPLTSAVLISLRDDVALQDAESLAPAEQALRFAKAVASRVITEWEGVGDKDGKELPVTPEAAAVVAFFEARMGRLRGFRWKDWSDYKSCLPSATPSAIKGAGIKALAGNVGYARVGEAPIFSKFFHRETGCILGAFRDRDNIMGFRFVRSAHREHGFLRFPLVEKPKCCVGVVESETMCCKPLKVNLLCIDQTRNLIIFMDSEVPGAN